MHLLTNSRLMARISLVSKSPTQKWHAYNTATSLCPAHLILASAPLHTCVPRAHSEFRPKPMQRMPSPGRTWRAGEQSAHTPLLPPGWIQDQDRAGKQMLSSAYNFFIWNKEHIAETKHLSLVIYIPYLAPLQLPINASFLLLLIRQPQSQKFRLK